jgi:hypothetical protein
MTFQPRLADRRLLAAAFVAAIRSWRDQHRRETLTVALASTGLSDRDRRRQTVDQLDFNGLHQQLTGHLTPQIAALYAAGWYDGHRTITARFGSGPDGVPVPVLLARDRVDALVDSTWDGAHQAAALVIAQKQDPWVAAGIILAVAGLNRPQAVSAVNWHHAITNPPGTVGDDGVKVPGKPPSPGMVERKLSRFVDQKLRKRGTLVGWYEPGHAVGLGRLDAWRFYGDHGGLVDVHAAGLVALREWTVGGNPCDACYAMKGTRVGLYEAFPGGDPPRHPSCRCSDVLVEATVGQAESLVAA